MPTQTHPLRSPQSLPDPCEQADPIALHALVITSQNPWLASLFMRRLTTLRERLGELWAWLESLPRRMRRAWARRWALALPAAALLLALTGGGATARMDATITVDAPGGVGSGQWQHNEQLTASVG